MSDPISMVSGAGSSIPAPLVNPQAQQVQAERPKPVADASGAANAGQARSSVVSGREIGNIAPNGLVGLSGTEQADKGNGVPKEAVTFTQEEVEEAVESFREFLEKLPSEMEFSFNKDIDRYLFKLVNPHTKEVVRQYPPDEFVTMVKRLKEASPDAKSSRNGILLDGRL